MKSHSLIDILNYVDLKCCLWQLEMGLIVLHCFITSAEPVSALVAVPVGASELFFALDGPPHFASGSTPQHFETSEAEALVNMLDSVVRLHDPRILVDDALAAERAVEMGPFLWGASCTGAQSGLEVVFGAPDSDAGVGD